MKPMLRVLNEARWTTLTFAVAAFAMTLLQSLAFFRMAGHTFAERAAFGYSLVLDATATAALLPAPVHPETVGGYLELRAFAPLAVIFAAWALVMATASGSGSIVARAGAFAISAALAAAAACVGVLIGVASGGGSVSGVGLVDAGLLLVALASACYDICLCAAQARRAPTVVAGGLLVTLFFVNSLSRIFGELAAVRWLSPFRYYDLSSPLAPDGGLDLRSLAMLVVIAVAGAALAIFLARRRGGVVAGHARTAYEPSRVVLLGLPVARELYPQRIGLAAWCIALPALAVLLVGATQTTMADLLALPRGLPGLPQYQFLFAVDLLDESWFEIALLLMVALAFVFVIRWANDDGAGRLAAMLSAPYSRSAVVLERLAALAVTAGVLAGISGLAVVLALRAASLTPDGRHVLDASVALLLFTIVLAAAGLLVTSWAPGAAGALFGAFVLAAYLDDQIGGALGLPAWAQTISPFRLMDSPLANGLDQKSVALLLALAVAGIGSSILVMQRRDIGR